ncbi:hypothetical protein BC939DRAFT_443543 [Gamsiella multidivaricata]|uniref:uncharacterized protein n=1 Tax=Gamsiella multidivaricata TaxID=101098 RepID=UPI002220569E|nr:uncharacterized protein BC939DRAFT_443543 [Gamsiella multidivaricata]KAI7828670.1 hypothetical protein BC939DRAFT_443543 [Gamsiella multidivaricata]
MRLPYAWPRSINHPTDEDVFALVVLRPSCLLQHQSQAPFASHASYRLRCLLKIQGAPSNHTFCVNSKSTI